MNNTSNVNFYTNTTELAFNEIHQYAKMVAYLMNSAGSLKNHAIKNINVGAVRPTRAKI
jgi:hypothetical protein